MFDIAWSELALIGAVALIVIGPKDLPKVMLKLGRWTRAAQRAAREFQASIEQLAEEAEAKDVARDLRALGREAKDSFSDTKLDYPRDIDPTSSVAPPPLSVLPPEGGHFRPPSEEDERVPAAAAKTGSAS